MSYPQESRQRGRRYRDDGRDRHTRHESRVRFDDRGAGAYDYMPAKYRNSDGGWRRRNNARRYDEEEGQQHRRYHRGRNHSYHHSQPNHDNYHDDSSSGDSDYDRPPRYRDHRRHPGRDRDRDDSAHRRGQSSNSRWRSWIRGRSAPGPRSRSSSCSSCGSGRRIRSRSRERSTMLQMAAQAALTAGGIEALKVRHHPGPWTGEKGRRVLTAALGAAAVNRLADNKDDGRQKPVRQNAGSALGGLILNRLMNGKS